MKTKVVHSQTKAAWNIVDTIPGDTYKLARIPYYVIAHLKNDDPLNQDERKRAYDLAERTSRFLNYSTASPLNEPSDESERVVPADDLKRIFNALTTPEQKGS